MEKSIKADDYPQPTVTREFSEDGKVEHGESGLNDPNHVELKRALKARHITMIGKCSSVPRCHTRVCADSEQPLVVLLVLV
jgi:amino acid permease